MGALRHAINQAWDIHTRPPLLRRKALDLALVLGAALVLVFSSRCQRDARRGGLARRRRLGARARSATCCRSRSRPPSCCSSTASCPARGRGPREIWPGAVVAAALISLVRGALELYFEHLADLGALYGSLGALMALLIFVYAVSLVLVFGAEYACEWSRLPKTRREIRSSLREACRYRG